jgi:flagellar hook-associated protein 2
MSRIQSSVGLITGIPIQDTVDQLIAVAARPRDLVTDRNKLLQAESLAVDKLASLVLALQFDGNKLKAPSLFTSRTATSSNAAALTAAVKTGGTPAVGSYLFTPVQTAAAQQLLSQSLETGQALGEGSFTFRIGGFVDKGVSLDALNSGLGIQRGEIRITDRSGANAVVDLRYARSVDDVLKAINSNTTINVTAEAVGDSFRITDNTGQVASNLIVQEVAGGTTAASLGLAGINVAANSATGTDVFTLHAGTRLSSLGDGNGVRIIDDVDDLSITLADESTLTVGLTGATTLGDVLDAINAADPAKLSAAIAADGNRLELTDLTAGGGTFAVTSVGTGTAAEDLGLTTTAAGDTITGDRLISGLRDVLVSTLRGGQGLGTLGSVDITNRENVSFSVDLSAAETLSEIVAAFNAQSTDVTAAINSSRSGIVLTDVSGATDVNFTVTDGDANNSATALGVAADVAATTVNSGSLGRQVVSEATLLSSLKQGAGVNLGDLSITDSDGVIKVIDLNKAGSEAQTVGDVIDAINAADLGVLARINDTGDGILLVDTVEGTNTLTVAEVGNGRIAADLGLLGSAVEVDIEGTPTFVIDGSSTRKVTIGEEDTLADLVKTINGLKAGVTASVVNDGVGERLSLVVDKAGSANELVLDTANSSLSLQQIAAARDGLLLYGAADSVGAGILVSSSSNAFDKLVNGLTLTIQDGTKETVTVSVANDTSVITKAVQDFVDAFNSIRDHIDSVTDFDEATNSTGVLFASNVVLRVESDLNRLLSGRFNGVGTLQTLSAIGVEFSDGKLSLDSAKLLEAYESDPDSFQQLLADKDFGLAAKMNSLVERLAVDENSALGSYGAGLARKIESNTERIDFLTEQLDRQRERLLLQFYNLESVVANFQTSLSALSNLQIIPPLSVNNRNSNRR